MRNLSTAAANTRRIQFAALPYRRTDGSHTEVMLVTSRDTQRWVIPKGWPQRGKAPCDSAAREAFEEAGVVGAVARRSVGTYRYDKRLKNGDVVVCEVHVFPLEVMRQSKRWPEKSNASSSGYRSMRQPKLCRSPSLAKQYVSSLAGPSTGLAR